MSIHGKIQQGYVECVKIAYSRAWKHIQQPAMAAHYDDYDYPSYWDGRDYEHEAEVSAVKILLDKIPSIKTVLDIGAGFGRTAPLYLHRARKVILTDPSAKLLKIAKESLKNKKVIFIQSRADTLPGKVKNRSVDLVVCIRVAHHIKDMDVLFKTTNKLLTKNGYFILEFANKCHLKAMVLEFLHGNFTFIQDIFPIDLRSKRTKKRCSLPFINYHPDIIKTKLKENDFEIREVLSVSNIRSPFLKRHFSVSTLMEFEKLVQKPATKYCLGPSIFILSQKKGSQ